MRHNAIIYNTECNAIKWNKVKLKMTNFMPKKKKQCLTPILPLEEKNDEASL